MHDRIIRTTTGSGVVEGFIRDGVNRWRSIPYAQPPVGPLRFRAPQPVRPWPGVRHCHSFAACAPQQRMYTAIGLGRYQPSSEDCLTLNVVAPENATGDALPVMVFIHGGAFILGSSATPIYDGASLARGGCVFVSLNYRLGALGCLDLSSLGTPDIPIESNLYLRDIVLALEWVRDNIAAFGGDPDNVTVFGESAGAGAVVSLLAVPAAKGLFRQAISESPPAGMTRSREVAAHIAAKFAALIGSRPADAAHALMEATPAQLVEAVDALAAVPTLNTHGVFALGPSFGDDILPEHPREAMRAGTANPVPLIIGTNAHEGRLFTRILPLLPTTENRIEALLAGSGAATRDRIIEAYPDYPHPKACVRIGGDFTFASAVWEIVEARAAHAPTFVYRYDYAPRPLHWSGLGATHATELFAVFDVFETRVGAALTLAGDRKSARRVSRDVQTRWREFARTGVPGADWPRYSADERAVRVFDRRSRVEIDPHSARRSAWASFTD
ncbi:MAG TPA: carboxylesterase/lipase family protein [Mycobacterium sp.]|nr:carboxylesterase/lipase family protein [Mycobacterium sp.]